MKKYLKLPSCKSLQAVMELMLNDVFINQFNCCCKSLV